MRKTLFLILFAILAISSVFGASAVVTSRPSQIDISDALSESAVLITVSAYSSDDARYRLYVGSNQYNCWDAATSTYITATSYGSGPQVPGTPTTSSTWWIPFQRGNNATTGASYRDRLGTAYSSNYQTAALPAATAITTAVSITNSNVTFTTWNTYTSKYVVLAYDSAIGGNLVSATSTALTTGAFDLKVETGTTISRIEVRDVLNTLIESVTGTWGSGVATPTINLTGTLTAFSTYTGTPSVAQSYTLSGSNLTANIAVTAPAGFALSTDNTTFTSTLSLAGSFSALVYVRLTGATAGPYSGNITHTSTGAAQVDLAATGTVTAPTPTISATGTLNAFTAIVGTPSAAQSYTLSGVFLTANIVVTPPAGFALSTDNTTFTGSLNLANTFNGLVYVRLTGTTVGPYSGNITHTSTGATQVDTSVTGVVSNPAGPAVLFEENFNYATGALLTDSGWNVTGTTTTPTVIVSEGSIIYPGYSMQGGNAVSLAVSGQDVNHTFDVQATGSTYSAFVINVTSSKTAGDYFLHFGGAAMGTSYYGRVFLKRDGTTDFAFIGLVFGSGTGAVTQYTTTAYPYGSNLLLVLKYQIVDGALNDVVSLFVNPTISETEPTATLTHANGYATTADLASIGSIGLRQGSSSNAAEVTVDGIRVTNQWSLLWDGTPPPTPVIVATGTPEPVYNIVGNPSEEVSSYNLSGTDLQGNINLVASTHFEISASATEGWDTSLSLASNYDAPVYVRLNTSSVGGHTGFITHNSSGAAEVRIDVEGETFAPDVTWNIVQALTAFSAEAGTPSAAQSYTLSATGATGNLAVSVDAPFELGTTGSGPWLASLDLAPTFNGNVYVRMNAATAGPFNTNIVHATANATNYDLAISGTSTPPAGDYASDLFFSEYIEGSSSNKALEIFNGTGVAVDLANYKVYLYSNGSPTPTNTLIFTAGTMLAHNDVYVIANASANAAILALSDVTSTVTFYNGDDAVSLVKVVGEVETYVDIIGVIDQDPGTQWTADGGYSTVDKTLVRKPTVTGGVTVNPTNNGDGIATDFLTLGTEWDIYPIDTITDLGIHTFAPGAQVAVAPVLTPAGAVYSSPVNVSMSSTTPAAVIYYTIDGSVPSDTNGFTYSTPVAVSATTTINAVTYATGYTHSSVTTENYVFPTLINNIAALRAQTAGATIYKLTGEAVLTFQQATRNQKYIQDATAAILIDDATGNITSTYNLYDGITGITGTLNLYSGLLQFLPVADPGAATSSNNVVVPEVRTFASLTDADQAKLIKVMNVSIDATNVNFGSFAENINVTDASATLVMRTFPATDYSGTAIPVEPVTLTCLVGQFNTTMQVSPRFLADIVAATGTLDSPIVTINRDGNSVVLNWTAIAGATGGYRIESSTSPYGTFTLAATVAAGITTWNETSIDKKFYRVIALP